MNVPLVAFVARFADEFAKQLKNKREANEYVEHLEREAVIVSALRRSQQLYANEVRQGAVATLAVRLLTLLHCKHEAEEASVDCVERGLGPQQAQYVYAHGIGPERVWAMLYHTYWLALNGRYEEARDLLLMSQFPEGIHAMPIPEQIMYNRCLAQIGLCAFAEGKMSVAFSAITDIMASGRYKELLGQGFTRAAVNKQSDEYKATKKRVVPHHTFTSLPLLDAVHIVSGMLLEVPVMATGVYRRQKQISRQFRRALDFATASAFQFTPDFMRDIVSDAGQKLLVGDWRAALQQVSELPAWSSARNADALRAVVKEKIAEAGLQCHLMQHTRFYGEMPVARLAADFEMTEGAVCATAGQLVSRGVLEAAVDREAGVVRATLASSDVQKQSFQLVERVAQLMGEVERTKELAARVQ